MNPNMNDHESIIFSAGLSEVSPRSLAKMYENEIAIRTCRTSFFNCLKNSAKQFYLKDKDGMFVDKVSGQAVVVEVPAKQINAAIGHYAKNKEFILNKYGVKPKFVSNSSLPSYNFNV